jgi:hypothetical protein
MSVVLHSFIWGQPFRLQALAEALAHVWAHRDRIWLTTPGAVHAAVRDRPALAV